MKRSIFVEIISVLLQILFLYAGVVKLMDYTLFKEQIASSGLLEPIANLVAWSLPKLEIAVAVILLVPRWRLIGLYSSFILMLLFTSYIVVILNFSKHIPCSCGGIIELLSWKGHFIFNGVFTGLALTGILLEKHIRKEDKIRLSPLANC